MSDTDALFPLQTGYEKEEVLPPGAKFYPASCRKVLESLIVGNMIMTAELEGKLVGKININGYSNKYFQIGGVYVLPEYRNMGIARAMTFSLIREYAHIKKYFTLFVKKKNIPARRVYDNTGFEKIADYRITYY
jgi:predicted GNAT family acetyltransferase